MLNINSINFNKFIAATKPKIQNKNKLSIYYYNDTHGNSDQMAGVVEAARNFKKQNKDTAHFVLSSGDNVSGADNKKNSYVFDLMQNIMQVDATAAGNHELDNGAEGLKSAMSGKNIPIVVTNAEFDDDSPMQQITKKSIIKEQNGIKYGFIGTMPIDFEKCTKKIAQEGIEVMDFDDTVEALQEEIDNLEQQGINRIILLSHTGNEVEKKLAENLDGVDIVMGGHSHTVIDGIKQGENLLTSKSNEPVIVTQAGENGKYYGLLDVEFDDNGIIKKASNTLVQSPQSEKSPVLEYIKEQNLGKSPLVAKLKSSVAMPKNRRMEPNAWTNLMADSMRNELDCDIAIINSANIRKMPKIGNLTQRDISETAPMKNKLLKTKVTQKQIVEAIKTAAKETMTSQNGEPGLLQVSGLTYKINDKGDLLEMNFIDKKGNKTPIDINNPSDSITYSAAYDDFVARDDGEYPLMAPKFDVEHFDFDKDDTTIKYISKLENKDNLELIDDKRLEILKTSQPQQLSNSNQKFLNLTVPKVS